MIEANLQAHPPVLFAKLNPPAAPPAQVQRTKVWEAVRASQLAQLILVRAPAGFGKTTTLAQIRAKMEENGVVTSWLTLDNSDNDAPRFLDGLAAAIAKITMGDSAGAPAGVALSPGQSELSLVDRLVAHPSPFALFLDDFQCIHEPAVLGLLRQIIDHLPRRGQIVIGSRSLPDLGLGRLRARGQLVEIYSDALRFSLAETAEFFNERRGLPLQAEDLSRLQSKTEGWVAALWLVSVALERREARSDFITRFSGTDQSVADYLANDVVGSQPQHVRDFLLRTSILRHLNAPLCDALMDRNDSALILKQIETANLFLGPIESEDGTYRYHSLFASFLLGELTRERPDEIPELHRRASLWYESQGREVPAIDHALGARDYEHALRLLSLHADDLLGQGRMRLLQRWFASLPDDVLERHPLLQTAYLWSLCFTRGPREAMALLEQMERREIHDPDVSAHVLALRPVLLSMMDRHEEAAEVGRERLLRLPTEKSFPNAVMTNAMAYVFSVTGQYDEARRLLDAARRTQGERVSAFNMMYSESVEGIIDLQEGRMRQATARFRIAVSATRASTYAHTNGNAWAGVLFASALYEANECEQAERLLHIYMPLAEDVGLVDHMISGHVMLSRIAFYHGDVDRAWQALTALEYIGHRRHLPRLVASSKLERSRVLLLQGYAHASKEELDRANESEIWQWVRGLRLLANDLLYPELCQLRWESSSGNPAQALPALEQEIAQAVASDRHRRVLKLRILHSLALDRSGNRAAALAQLGSVLHTACAEGFMRLILDEGDRIGALVRQYEAAGRQQGSGRSDPIFTEYLQRLLQGFGPGLAEAEPAKPATNAPLPEPLTRKEIRILQLLAEGYSNSAMAEKVFVSDSTVRTHLRNISAKLGANNRTQAVAMARRSGLIR